MKHRQTDTNNMPNTVLEWGGVLDNPETELSPEGPSTGGSLPLGSSSLSPAWFITSSALLPNAQALLTNTQRTIQAHSLLVSALQLHEPPSPKPSSNGQKRKTAEDPLDTDIMQRVDDLKKWQQELQTAAVSSKGRL